MDASKQEDLPPSPAPSQISLPSFGISPSNLLTVPTTRPSGTLPSLPGPKSFEQDGSNLSTISSNEHLTPVSIPLILEPSRPDTPIALNPTSQPLFDPTSLSDRIYMSVYSTSSVDSEFSTYSNPPAKTYKLPSFETMSSSRKITTAEKSQMIDSLRAHHVNTLVELRRIEKAFAVLGSSDVTEPMTTAWSYYVNSHGLLTELRGLTKNYPFSSDCLEEAKRRVYSDPQSNRSWNFCWLVLNKIQRDQLIPYYAHYQASQPAMWGGRTPSSDKVAQLTDAFVKEWNWAVGQMLRHWDQPPSR